MMNLILKLFKRKKKVRNDPHFLGNTPQEIATTILGVKLIDHDLFKDDPVLISAANSCTSVKEVLDLMEETAMIKSSHLKTLPANIAGIFKRRGISDARIKLWTKKKKPAANKPVKQRKKYYYLVRGRKYLPINNKWGD